MTTLDDINIIIDGTDAPTVGHPAGTDAQNALLAWAAAHPIERATVPLNGQGRYHTVNPVTGGKAKGHTRASTFASTLDDAAGLVKWRNGILMRGIAMRPELAQAAANVVDDDRELRNLAGTALAVGGEKLAADIGTALHLACEWTHEPDGPAKVAADIALPDEYRADVAAYTATLAAHGLTIAHVECNLFTPETETVGRFDALVSGPWGDELRVLDIKTGSDPVRISYAVQLASLANASHIYDGTDWQPAPAIDRTVAYITHMPAGTGRCDLVSVDVAAGWELALLSVTVRNARSSKTVAPMFATLDTPAAPVTNGRGTVVDAVPFPATAPADRCEWITGRITTLCASTAAKALLGAAWPDGCPKVAPWTDEQIDAIVPVLEDVETAVEAPFPHLDPSQPTPDERHRAAQVAAAEAAAAKVAATVPQRPTPDNGAEIHADEVAPLSAAAKALASDRRDRAAAWAAEGRRYDRPWGRTKADPWNERALALNIAAMRCVEHLWDDDEPDTLTRAALALVLGEDVQPAWATGAVIGSLTLDEAHRLDDIAAAFGAGDQDTTAALVAVVTAA